MFRNHGSLFLLCGLLLSGSLARADPDPGIKYVENKNQWPASIQYSARIPGGRMFVQPGSFTYCFIDQERLQQLHERSHHSQSQEGTDISPSEKIDGIRMQVNFVGSRKDLIPVTEGRSKEYYNYFLGNDSSAWAANAYAYQSLHYASLYNGIDLNVYSSDRNVKYDFIVAPQADPSQIRLSYSGNEQMVISGSGDLNINAAWVEMIEKKPVAFQIIDGKRIHVPCEYRLRGFEVTFAFPDGYDPCYELTIDPLLIFSTYSGSTADNWGSTATPGEDGNLYSAGITNEDNYGGNFPATNGAFQVSYGGIYDVAILKYDSAGTTMMYATYLGGSRSESAHSLVMNHAGDLVVLGTTSSADFPTSTEAWDRSFGGGTLVTGVVIPYEQGSDIFIATLNKTGNHLLSSTYLGGSLNDGINPAYGPLTQNYGDQQRGDIITDANNNVYISSVTASNDFPLVNSIDNSYNGGATDAIVVKLTQNLSQVIWSTYLGGEGVDASHTIKFDKTGDLFVGGGTTSLNFPVTAEAYQTANAGGADGWILTLDAAGTAVKSATLTGTNAFDQVYFLDLNADDEVYVYGQTSGNFPVTAGVYSNPNSGQFIQKLSHDLSSLIFSTVVGSGRGIPDISPTAFLVNDCNNIYLTGWGGVVNINTFYWQNNTMAMPITPDAFQSTTSGSDFYFMVLTDDASQFLYGTYLGGGQSRTHVDGGTSRFDKGGIVYHAVCSGCRSFNATNRPTSDFPTTSNAWSRRNNSANCNNAAFKFDLSSLKARIQSNSVMLNEPGLNKICIPDPIVFQNFSTGVKHSSGTWGTAPN